jgi:GNAT superfamily N-acetyltransferase
VAARAPQATIRRLRPDEVGIAIEFAASEGWNPGQDDAATFAAIDPRGFFVAECDGLVVGSVSAVRWSDAFGFMGFYIVRPGYRGHGYGLQLWAQGLEYLGARVIGLDAVPSRVSSYERSGFVLAYGNQRYVGNADAWRAPGPRTGSDPRSDDGTDRFHIHPVDDLSDSQTVQLMDLAARSGPGDRAHYIRTWTTQPAARTRVALSDQDAVVGLVVCRPCRIGWRVGPLLSPSAHVAEALMCSVLEGMGPQEISVDMPEPAVAAHALALGHGMIPTSMTHRMYKGQPRHYDPRALFAIASPELG